MEIPSLYMISKVVVRNGGATLFLTTLTLTWLPMTLSSFLSWAERRTSTRSEA